MPGEQFGGGSVIVTVGGAGAGHQLVNALQARGVDAVGVATSTGDSRADLVELFSLASRGAHSRPSCTRTSNRRRWSRRRSTG